MAMLVHYEYHSPSQPQNKAFICNRTFDVRSFGKKNTYCTDIEESGNNCSFVLWDIHMCLTIPLNIPHMCGMLDVK